MRLYLDDDSASSMLVRLLRQAGYDVELPSEVGMSGFADAVHFTYAIEQQRVLLSRNFQDFEDLHDLVIASAGHHPGIFVIRQDNDPRRDLTPGGIARTIRKFLDSGTALADNYVVLNHWR